MRILALDIGGSGVKTAVFSTNEAGPLGLRLETPARRLGAPTDWDHFEPWLAGQVDLPFDALGVACAGFVDATAGVVRFFRVGGWRDRPLAASLGRRFPGRRVVVLNDAEAHLSACMDGLYEHPVLSLSLGTSLGFAATEERGTIARPRADSNFDLGSMRLPSRASNPEVWWALGSEGLKELEQRFGAENGVRHFAHRLGAFLADLTVVFQPRSIVLSGGIIATHWKRMSSPVCEEFGGRSLPEGIDTPFIGASRFGEDAALWGVARMAAVGS